MLLYFFYQAVVTLLFVLVFPLMFLFQSVRGNIPYGLADRFGSGLHIPPKKETESLRIWIHAASVGEVQAAKALINELKAQEKNFEFFLSTITEPGRAVAQNQLTPEVYCFLAPLDIFFVVRRFLAAVEPDIYICMETELWPAMFIELNRSRIPAIVLNGRLTPSSLRSYRRIGGLMHEVLGNVSGVAVISKEDKERFHELGVPEKILSVSGNIKYDYPAESVSEVRSANREVLHAGGETVFICGSTRTGEEEILLEVYNTLQKQCKNGVIWVIAPRHLDRLDEVKKMLTGSGLKFDLFSKLYETGRTNSVVLVDTIGDLTRLYSAGDFNFVGGSLVNERGHNIMEAARWGKPVYYGPSIGDFKDAAEILERAGGAFRVSNGNDLAALLSEHLKNKKQYENACENASHAVSLQRGAAGRQVDLLMQVIAGHSHSTKQMS